MRWIFLMMFSIAPAFAQEMEVQNSSPWYVPSHITWHSASYQGAYTGGVSYDVASWYAWGLSFGYTPHSLGGQEILQWNWRNQFHLSPLWSDTFKSGPYVLLGMLYTPDQDMFTRLPNQYPKGYYSPSAFRYLLGMGYEMDFFSGFKGYIEYVAHDSEVIAYERSPHRGFFDAVGTYGLGVKIPLSSRFWH